MDATGDEHFDSPRNGFSGFSSQEIEDLIARLTRDHLGFAHQRGIIHGDVILPDRNPTNVVYNPARNVFFLVDGEALGPLTDESETRFYDQIESLREWTYANLERIPSQQEPFAI